MAEVNKSAHETFEGEVKVASRIVDFLSSSLYKSPAACLKELINNSYDADATKVNVFIKPDADRVIIEDNGCGMSKEEFVQHFQLVAESHKRDSTDITDRRRPKIGKIGIGFLAANEICNRLELVSTKKGSKQLLKVTLRFDLMRESPERRRRGDSALAKGDYHGEVEETDEDSHFTQIFLKEIRGPARNVLAGARPNSFSSGEQSLYGLTAPSIRERLADPTLRTWDQFDEYSQSMLKVGLNVPVRYHDTWLPPSLAASLPSCVEQVDKLDFSLYFDGTEIRKPIVLVPPGEAVLERFSHKGEHVTAHGYFYGQHTAIKPQELQGLLVRIRNAAVGEYDPSFLRFSSNIGPLFQRWISAEIWADDRLEPAMNIDRRTLREVHPAFTELQQAVHAALDSFIKRVRKELHGAGSSRREIKKAASLESNIETIVKNRIAPSSQTLASAVRVAWRDATTDEDRRRRLVRRFTVVDLYKIIIEVAEQTLSHNDFEKLLSCLTERLTK